MLLIPWICKEREKLWNVNNSLRKPFQKLCDTIEANEPFPNKYSANQKVLYYLYNNIIIKIIKNILNSKPV